MQILIGEYTIRNFEPADAPSIARYADNPKIAANLRDAFPSPYALSDAQAFISMVTEQSPRTVFAISTCEPSSAIKSTSVPAGTADPTQTEAIGSIGLMLGQDVHRYTAELGYWLAEPFWGRGIVTDAVRAVCEYGFSEFQLNRIYAEPYAQNRASARVLEKAGFEFEGRLRCSAVKNGKVLDQLMYSRIRKT